MSSLLSDLVGVSRGARIVMQHMIEIQASLLLLSFFADLVCFIKEKLMNIYFLTFNGVNKFYLVRIGKAVENSCSSFITTHGRISEVSSTNSQHRYTKRK